MPDGKPAGVRCIHLTADYRCAIFGKPERPAVCNSLRASVEMCGSNAREAYEYLARLERSTRVVISAAKLSPELSPRERG